MRLDSNTMARYWKWSLVSVSAWAVLLSCSHNKAAYVGVDDDPEPTLDVIERVILLGDGGEPGSPLDLTLQAAASRASKLPDRTTVAVLGDNVYGTGLPPRKGTPEEVLREKEEVLTNQIDLLVASGARVIFLPGNHDWNGGKKASNDSQSNVGDGCLAVERQADFIEEASDGQAEMIPKDCTFMPRLLSRNGIHLILIDTQSWLHPDGYKPLTNEAAAITELKGQLASIPEQETVMVLAHHPLASHGKHGGNFGLQGLKSLYIIPFFRSMGLSKGQDLSSRKNKEMVNSLVDVLDDRRPLIFAAGHDHSLQLLKSEEGPEYILVSGSASKTSPVWHGPDTLFAYRQFGFMEVDVLEGGAVFLRVWVNGKDKPSLAYWLKKGRTPAGDEQ